MPILTVLIVNQKPFTPDVHITATLRNLKIQSDSVELIVNPDYREMVTLQTTVALAARKHGFEADFTKCVCTPYDSSDGVKGIAVQVNGGTKLNAAKTDETNKQNQEDKGNCFIATAAYGTPEAPTVLLLQDFRDEILRPQRIGKFFIKQYEKLSPPIASIIAVRPGLRLVVRKCLLIPLSFCARKLLQLSLSQKSEK